MAVNIVEVLIRAKNETAPAFAEADASSASMSKAVTKAGLVAAAGLAVVGVEAVRMATSFQSSMEMLVTQAGVPQAKLKGLQQDVLNLAGQVGFSPDSLAESLYHVASNMESMGATSATMMKVVKVAAEGARVGGADLVDVTNALTAAVASGIPGVKNYSQAMGMLNATVGAGDMKMQDLAEAFGSGMVATVKGFGLSLKDVGAALATFGDNNIRGAHAGTMLRMSVMALAVPAAAGKKQLEAMGLSMTSLATDMRQGGLLKALDDLHNHLVKAGVTAKEQGDVITQVFGKKAGAGLNVLMDQLDRLKSKYPAIAKGAEGFGKAWGKTQGTMKQQLDDLRAGFDALMVTLGDKLLPVVQSVVSWMDKHRAVMVTVLEVALALAGGLATLAVAIKVVEIATKAWEIVQAILDAELLANPLTYIVAGLVLLAVAIYETIRHWKTFEKIGMEAFEAVRRAADDAMGFIKRIIGDAVDFIKAHWQLLLAILTGPIGLAVYFIKGHWDQLVTWTGNLIHDVVHWFEQLPGMILHALASLGSMLFRAGQNAMHGLISGLASMIGAVGSTVSGIASKVAGFFGLSPAKEGPLAGGGAPEIRGRHLVDAFGHGMMAGLPDLATMAARMARTVSPYSLLGAGNGGRYPAIEIVVSYDQSVTRGLGPGLLADLRYTVRTVGGGDVQVALGRSS